MLLPTTVAEQEDQAARRRAERPAAIWPSFLWLTLFQVLTCLQLIVADGAGGRRAVPLAFLGLTVVMWLYYVALRAFRCVGFEMETIAFFLSTLSLAVTASSAPASVPKQLLAILLGLVLFLVLGVFLRDLDRVQKIRWLMAAGAIGLLGITLVLGSGKYGAANWISLGGCPSSPRRSPRSATSSPARPRWSGCSASGTWGCSSCSPACASGCLALMSDFGTAAIFFVTFLVIAYLRSGDFATLALICGGAVFGAGIML